MELMTHEEFWGKNPAPGTRFLEMSEESSVVVARGIDPETDDPDDIVAVGFTKSSGPIKEDQILVLEWGSWEGHEELLAQHSAAVTSEEGEGFNHVCRIGLGKKEASENTSETSES
jgi:hypothetical protein